LAGLRLCMVMHVGNSGGARAWQGRWAGQIGEPAHPGQRVPAKDPLQDDEERVVPRRRCPHAARAVDETRTCHRHGHPRSRRPQRAGSSSSSCADSTDSTWSAPTSSRSHPPDRAELIAIAAARVRLRAPSAPVHGSNADSDADEPPDRLWRRMGRALGPDDLGAMRWPVRSTTSVASG
jgi:hypothetical protein